MLSLSRRNQIIVKPLLLCFFALVLITSAAAAADTTNAHQRKPGDYPLGPDSLPQEGVPRGKLEGPFLFHSQIFTNAVRKYSRLNSLVKAQGRGQIENA